MPPDGRRQRRGARAFRTGHAGEAAAVAALLAEGWTILARRARGPAGEIDIIAANGTTLIFVEVKARPSFREAAFALSAAQQRRLYAAGEAWLAANPQHAREETRFDVILVAADGALHRIRDAIRF
ncbi:MAG: YraN family protein [Acetobacteraceae bacterium]|nr:YraN family protein [Acetobacteraceae bacterium]